MLPLFVHDGASSDAPLMSSKFHQVNARTKIRGRSRKLRNENRKKEIQKLAWDNLGFSKTDMANLDALFVAIDFEDVENLTSLIKSENLNSKRAANIGISILDTRDLSDPRISPYKALKTYNLCVQACPSRKRWQDSRFQFGKTIWLPSLKYFKPSIELAMDRSRNIILVGHGMDADLIVLRELGVDLETSVKGVIDTQLLQEAVHSQIPPLQGRGLKGMLARLGCPVGRCHIAGYDANYTLRALLLLTAEGLSNSEGKLTGQEGERLSRLRAIGLSPIAYTGEKPLSPTNSCSEGEQDSESEEE